MKWRIHNEYINSLSTDNLINNIKNNGLSSFILKMITNKCKNNDTITIFTDDSSFMEDVIKEMISLCYKNEVYFDIITENHICIYKSDRIKKREPKDFEKWYLTFSKVTFTSDEGEIVTYHLHFSNGKKKSNLNLICDKNL